MYRQTEYAFQIPYETDILSAQRFMYEGLGLIAMDMIGTTTAVAGFTCVPTSPATLTVNVTPGRIYSLQNLEPTIWGQVGGVGGLAADTNSDHNIVKQGQLRDTTNFSCPAPGTSGQSINYLIEVAFAENDTTNVVLPFFNSSNPSSPWSGPSNLGGSLPTVRQDQAVVQVKAGTAATTGTQTTPAPDAGNVGMFVVTVANGQSTITSGNITNYQPSSFMSPLQLKAPIASPVHTGSIGLSGATSGIVSLFAPTSFTSYNFNLPASAGASGVPLLSGGGGSSPMTWGTVTGSGNFVLSASPTLTGTIIVGALTNVSFNSVSAPNNTATTVLAFSGLAHGFYKLYLTENGAANRTATAELAWDGTTLSIISQTNNGASLTFSVSTTNLQVTQTSGTSQSCAGVAVLLNTGGVL